MKNLTLSKTFIAVCFLIFLSVDCIAQPDTVIGIQNVFLNNTKDTTYSKGKNLIVEPAKRNLRIELYPPLSIKDSFSFYLEGYSLDTVKTHFPTIQFTNLIGGHYILNIALWRDGHKYAPLKINIDVKEKLIEQDWFQITLFLSILLVISGFSFLAIQYNYRQKMRDQNLRLKLSADLHERIGALLTSINVWAKVLKRELTDQLTEENQETINKIIGSSKDATQKLRETIWLTNPEMDLMNKLFERMSKTATEMLKPDTQPEFDYIPEEVENMKISMRQREDVFMMFIEIINNIRKHAEASQAFVTIRREKHFVRLIIRDNGKGFDVEQAYEGHGLKSLHWRAKRSFIQLNIQSELGQGATVTMVIPEL
ncbi:MAG: hypothetical protein JNL70_28340 [Saprospiraceae bacterium]|nr:hypothetical protein [Saprospiraceae bacterium]